QVRALMHCADQQSVLRISKVVIALCQAKKILLLSVLDALEHLGVAKKDLRLVERQKVLVKILYHRFGVALGEIVDTYEISNVFVAKFKKVLAPQQFLLSDIRGDFGVPDHSLALFHVAIPHAPPAASRSSGGSAWRAPF